MSRRLCITALVLALLLPAAPLFADDDRWQMPNPGTWIADLVQLLLDFDGEKSDTGNDSPPEAPKPPDEIDPPGGEAGPLLDPSG